MTQFKPDEWGHGEFADATSMLWPAFAPGTIPTQDVVDALGRLHRYFLEEWFKLRLKEIGFNDSV